MYFRCLRRYEVVQFLTLTVTTPYNHMERGNKAAEPRRLTGFGYICIMLMMHAILQPRFRISPPGLPEDMVSSTMQNVVHRPNHAVEAFQFPQLRTKRSNIPGAGLGVFAFTDIQAGNFLTEYGGDVVDWKRAKELWANVSSSLLVD